MPFWMSWRYALLPDKKQDVANSLVYADIMKNYNWGIILCTDNLKTGQQITLELESAAFLAGCHFAFGATECENCEICAFDACGQCAAQKKSDRLYMPWVSTCTLPSGIWDGS